ncbi:unnamed protein product [Prunus armeniaca]|uniref:Uncharacterized protein n=1 Tax=Prunus armeniaca TaxID=36596 RepID=A0A6J5TUH5_PRUAR|nr:unnamed protein product [Prunus armeniaca]
MGVEEWTKRDSEITIMPCLSELFSHHCISETFRALPTRQCRVGQDFCYEPDIRIIRAWVNCLAHDENICLRSIYNLEMDFLFVVTGALFVAWEGGKSEYDPKFHFNSPSSVIKLLKGYMRDSMEANGVV